MTILGIEADRLRPSNMSTTDTTVFNADHRRGWDGPGRPGGHVGLDVTRRDGGRADAVAGLLEVDGLHEGDQRSLAGAVHGEPYLGVCAGDGREGDDPRGTGGFGVRGNPEQWQRGLDQDDRGDEVDVERLVHPVDPERAQGPPGTDAGVQHQRVHGSECVPV
jgi:hypothetical protein